MNSAVSAASAEAGRRRGNHHWRADMRKHQSGVSLLGLLIVAALLIAIALLGMKLAPSYIEFYSIKKALVSVAAEKANGSPAEIRKAFDAHCTIDAISSVGPQDLEITKDGGELLISVGYRKEIPLVANVGVYINFNAASKE
jgi:hypothetical protein